MSPGAEARRAARLGDGRESRSSSSSSERGAGSALTGETSATSRATGGGELAFQLPLQDVTRVIDDRLGARAQ